MEASLKEIIPQSLEDIAKELDEKYESVKNSRTFYESNWFLNMAYFLGKQWTDYRKGQGRLQEVATPSWRIKLVSNFVLNFVTRFNAMILRYEPTPKILPSNRKDESVIDASIAADKLCQYLNQKLDMQALLHKVYELVALYGRGFLKPYFDKNAGDSFWEYKMTTENNGHPKMVKDPEGIETQDTDSEGKLLFIELDDKGEEIKEYFHKGDICCDVVSPLEFYPDPGACSHEELRWCIQVRYRDISELKDIYKVTVEPQEDIEMMSIGQEINRLLGNNQKTFSKAALEQEYWEVPSERYPKGRHIIKIGKQVVVNEVIPKEYLQLNPPLPYIPFSFVDVPGRYWPKTPVDDGRQLQRQYNQAFSQLLEYKNLMASPKWLVPEQCLIPQGMLNTEPGQIITYLWGPWGAPQPAAINVIPQGIVELLAMIKRDLDEILGMYDLSAPGMKIRSGQGLSQLQEMQESRVEPVLDDLKAQSEKLWKAILYIVKNNFSESRMLKVVGKEGVDIIPDFTGQDIDGCEDPIVELGANLPQNKVARTQVVIQYLASGIYDRNMALKALEIEGDDLLSENRLDESKAKKETEKMNQGIICKAEEYDNPLVHLTVHYSDMKEDYFEKQPEAIKKIKLFHAKSHEEMMKTGKISPDIMAKMQGQQPQAGKTAMSKMIPPAQAQGA